MAGTVIAAVNTSGQFAASISGFGYGYVLDKTEDFRWIFRVCALMMLVRIVLVAAIARNRAK